MSRDYVSGDCQPYASTGGVKFLRFLASLEVLGEEFGEFFWRDAYAGVFYGDAVDLFITLNGMAGLFSFDFDFAAFLVVFHGVVQKISQSVFDLVGVSLYG